METQLIKDATLVNEGKVFTGSLLIKDRKIEKIYKGRTEDKKINASRIINAKGLYLFPGIIDDQVHFREPGLTHKADFRSETRAAIAGGVTSIMEMPNTLPQTTTRALLAEKFEIVTGRSFCNYSFYFGATNDNLQEVLKVDPSEVCGIKVFMGSSTGNMLVDNKETLAGIFKEAPCLVAVHCEDESTIKRNTALFREKYGENLPIRSHPMIRSEEACYISSSLAVDLAKKYNTRLHILHISTGKELELFDPHIPHTEKRITSEVCIHHLWFDEKDYDELGSYIKWNPAIKTSKDKDALLAGVLENSIDIIATDHAPHTKEEKENTYFKAPSGGPMVQHSLIAMLEFYHQGKIKLEKIVDKMCHIPADIFHVDRRGYLREGYWADLCLVDLNAPWKVSSENILYKCGWSPFTGLEFHSRITHTFVNGHLTNDHGNLTEDPRGMKLEFNR